MKLIKVLLAVVLCAMFAIVPVFEVFAENTNKTIGIDTVIVLDASGSMRKKSDTNRVAINAANMYVDYTESSDSSIAFIAFSHEIKVAVDFTSTSTQENRDMLHEKIDSVNYSGDTDIGLAMKKADEFITARKQKEPNRKITVLFLSDGKTAFEADDATRTVEQSNADLDAAVADFAANEIKVYAIGLDKNDEYTNEESLNKIAADTNGFARFTHDALDLPTIIADIFSSSQGAKYEKSTYKITKGSWETIPVVISSASILESNIVLWYDGEIDIKLYNPDGTEVNVNDSDACMPSYRDNYTALKLSRPQKGEWTLKMRCTKSCNATIFVTDFYDFKIDLNVYDNKTGGEFTDFITPTHFHDGIAIAASFVENTGYKLNAEMYSGVVGTAILRDADGNTQKYDMTFDEEALQMVARDIDVAAYNGEYAVWCEFVSADIRWDTEEATISLLNSLPTVAKGKFKIYVDKAKGVRVIENINSVFSDADGDSFAIKVKEDESSLCNVYITDDNALHLENVSNDCQITLSLTDEHGAVNDIVVDVAVQNVLMIMLICIGVALLLAVIIACCVVSSIRRRQGALNGMLSVSIDSIDWCEVVSLTPRMTVNGRKVFLNSQLSSSISELANVCVCSRNLGKTCMVITASRAKYLVNDGSTICVDLGSGVSAVFSYTRN